MDDMTAIRIRIASMDAEERRAREIWDFRRRKLFFALWVAWGTLLVVPVLLIVWCVNTEDETVSLALLVAGATTAVLVCVICPALLFVVTKKCVG
jgi:hypothetical protein